MQRFKELEIWNRSKLFFSKIYELNFKFSEAKKFGLTNQFRCASVSILSNIGEDSSRNSSKDFSRLLEILLGSAYEIESQLLIARDLQFISKKENR